MNQPESGRATAEDLQWLEGVLRTGDHPRHRRILNSLRAPAVPVADRERLARALYIINSSERQEPSRAAFWESGEPAVYTREHWLGEADRLQRILGGFSVATEERAESADALERAAEELRKARAYYARQGWWDNEQDAQTALDGVRALMRSTPPVPVVQQEPRAWECPECGRLLGRTDSDCAGTAGEMHKALPRSACTPLFALETTNGK